jgi:3-isopropylmalate/(R)-2-methylmalate dehydratase small subunit
VALRAMLEETPGSRIAVDLEKQQVTGPDGVVDAFDIDAFRKECLLAGSDDISFTLSRRDRIEQFEKNYEAGISWL